MEDFKEVCCEHQLEAMQNYANLLRSFSPNAVRVATDYPSYYGGSFINEDGKLVILITDDLAKGKEKVIQTVANVNIEVKPAQYSFRVLTQIMDILNSFVAQECKENPVAQNFVAWGITDAQNRVDVILKDNSEECIAAIKKLIIDSPAIRYHKQEKEFVREVSINAGGEIRSDAKGSSSVGFRARRYGRDGIVISGHACIVNERIKANNGVAFAIVDINAYSNYSKADAAFTEIYDYSYTPENLIQGTSAYLSTTEVEPAVGNIVNRQGISTPLSSGTVQQSNASTIENNIVIEDLYSANYASAKGDSGGIVYTYVSSTNSRFTSSIHHGSLSLAYFVKPYNIRAALGTTRY